MEPGYRLVQDVHIVAWAACPCKCQIWSRLSEGHNILDGSFNCWEDKPYLIRQDKRLLFLNCGKCCHRIAYEIVVIRDLFFIDKQDVQDRGIIVIQTKPVIFGL